MALARPKPATAMPVARPLAKPTTKQTMETSADFLMFFSTMGPANAADMPRKKMASEKPHSTEAGLALSLSAMSCLNTLQQ